MDKPFSTAPDLDNPAVLAEQAESLAGGMRQQASMARTGTAMGGHPNPEYLYSRAADVLTKCAETIRQACPPPPADLVGEPVTAEAPPAPPPEAPRKRTRKTEGVADAPAEAPADA